MIPEEQWGDGMNFMNINRVRSRIKVRVERAGDGPWRRCITTSGPLAAQPQTRVEWFGSLQVHQPIKPRKTQ